MNARQDYFDLLNGQRETVHSTVATYIEKLTGHNQDLMKKMMILPNKRNSKPIMRSTITKLFFDAFSKKEQDLSTAMAISEINNTYEYLVNILIDNKNGMLNGDRAEMIEKIQTICVTALMAREIQEKMVMDLNLSPEAKLRILSLGSEAMAKCAEGQAIDVTLTLDKMDQFQSDEEYLSLYTKKSGYQTGCLYGWSAQIGAIMAGASDTEIELAYKIGFEVGIGVHISNDLGDFAVIDSSTGFKTYQDQFADLRNGRLSLPVYWVLKYGTDKQKKLFHDFAEGKECDCTKIAQAIHETGAYSFVKKQLNRYELEAKKLIRQLPESETRDMLSAMSSVIRTNKYLFALQEGQRTDKTPVS